MAKKTSKKAKKEAAVEEVEPLESQPVRKRGIKRSSKLFFILVFAGLCAGGAWYYQQQKIDQLNNQNAVLQTKLTVANAATKKANDELAAAKKAAEDKLKEDNAAVAAPVPESLKENVAAAVNAKDTTTLQSLMAGKVNWIIAGSSGQGSYDSQQMAEQIAAYLQSAATPWNFNVGTASLNTYQNGAYKTYLSDDVIFGVSSNKYLVSFHLNSSNKIDQVFMTNNTDALN